MATKITNQPQEKLIEGVNKLANAVKTTLGPYGRNVIIEREYDQPHITKDGATVAKSISLRDNIENMGARIVREASLKTASDVGDGTTTTCVLVQGIVNGLKSSTNPIKDQREITELSNKVINKILKIKKECTIEDISKIATVSANNDSEIGGIVSEAYGGRFDRLVSVIPGESASTTIDVVNGMRIKRGLISPIFGERVELKNCLIACYKDKIVNKEKIIPVMELAKRNGSGLLLIAPDYSQECTNIILNNFRRDVVQVCAIKSPGFSMSRAELIEDIMSVVGSSNYIDTAINVDPNNIGHAERVVITSDFCDIIDGHGDPTKRIEEINKIEIDNINRDEIKNRLANLTGGVAVITVGGQSEVEIKEKADRFEDAVCAVHSAIKGGIVPGGGITLARVAASFDSGKLTEAEDVFLLACRAPFQQILLNAGIDDEEINEIVDIIPENVSLGYDITKEHFDDFYSLGIVDPADVTINALKNAVSVATMLMTSGASVSIED